MFKAHEEFSGHKWTKEEVLRMIETLYEYYQPGKFDAEIKPLLEEDEEFLFVLADMDVEWDFDAFKSTEQEECLQKFTSQIRSAAFD